MKRLVCWILMAVMLLTTVPAMADNVRTSGDFQYTIKGNGTATIVGYTGKHTDIILPNLIDGYPITTIGEGAFALDESPDFSLVDSISVTLPNTTISIEAKAFANRNIRSINIPDTVEYIGYGAFIGCNTVQFRISNNHACFATINGSLYNKQNKELLKWVGTDSSVDIIVPEGILSIGDYAFADMSIHYSASINLPQTLKRIGNYAFWSFQDTEGELIVPESVSEIGAFAFADAYMDIDVSRCMQLETIPERAFANTYDDKYITDAPRIFNAPKNIKYIEAYAFYRSTVLDLDSLLSNVEKIGPYAFSQVGNGGMVINIPSNCKIVDEGAFYKTYNVCEINIAHGVERIESKAFLSEGYGLVESVYLPASLTYIALDAFDKEVTYVVEKGSYAERWVRDNAFTYTINGEEQNLDWLNN